MTNNSVSNKPVEVNNALRCLWASLWIGVINAAVVFAHLPSHTLHLSVIITLAWIALSAFIFRKISQGRRWAWWITVFLTSLGALNGIRVIEQAFERSPMSGILTLTVTALSVYAVYSLMTKQAIAWLREMNLRG